MLLHHDELLFHHIQRLLHHSHLLLPVTVKLAYHVFINGNCFGFTQGKEKEQFFFKSKHWLNPFYDLFMWAPKNPQRGSYPALAQSFE